MDVKLRLFIFSTFSHFGRCFTLPDDNKITVLSKGNSNGLIASIPIGGHIAPNSTVGERALWKKVQKIATKNKASDTIKRATPILSPLWTAKVWLPIYVPSDIISRNQNDIDNTKVKKANVRKYSELLNPWKDKTPEVVRVNKLILVYNGQGEGETKWKGWAWKLLLCIFNKDYSYIRVSIITKIYNNNTLSQKRKSNSHS